MVHVHVGEDAGHGQRMGHIGFTTAANLAVVGLLGKIVGASDLTGLLWIQVAA